MNFRVKPLGELCNLSMGKTPARGNSRYWDPSRTTKNIWISIADMTKSSDAVLVDSKEYLSDIGSNSFTKVKAGTLLMSFKLSIGKLAIAGTDLQTNEAIIAMNELNEGLVLRDYLFYFLYGFDWSDALQGRFKVKGNTLNKKILEELPIHFPSLEDQQSIVQKLHNAFIEIDFLEKNLDMSDLRVEQLLHSLLRDSVSKPDINFSTKDSSAQENNHLSAATNEATIEDLCNVEYGTRVVRKKDAGTNYPVYGGGGQTFFLDSFNREDRVVIARFAMSEKCTRRVIGKFALNDSGLTLSPKDKSILRQDFLDYYVLSLNDKIYGCGRGTAQKNLDVPAFRQMNVCYPVSLDTQREIVEKLDLAFAEIDRIRNQIAIKKDFAIMFRQSLLKKSFSPSDEMTFV